MLGSPRSDDEFSGLDDTPIDLSSSGGSPASMGELDINQQLQMGAIMVSSDEGKHMTRLSSSKRSEFLRQTKNVLKGGTYLPIPHNGSHSSPPAPTSPARESADESDGNLSGGRRGNRVSRFLSASNVSIGRFAQDESENKGTESDKGDDKKVEKERKKKEKEEKKEEKSRKKLEKQEMKLKLKQAEREALSSPSPPPELRGVHPFLGKGAFS